jgi:hypothetical protein
LISIELCRTDSQVKDCYPVLRQLHEDLGPEDYLQTTNRLFESGYQLVYLADNNEIKSVAGFHIGESYSWKRYLYIDDMVTDAGNRSKRYGGKLLDWIKAYAVKNDCKQLHLDSRVIRHGAHKFYINQGLIQGGYHFHLHL